MAGAWDGYWNMTGHPPVMPLEPFPAIDTTPHEPGTCLACGSRNIYADANDRRIIICLTCNGTENAS